MKLSAKLELGTTQKGHTIAALVLEAAAPAGPRRPRCHTLIVDCSGSMSASMKNVREDVVSFVRSLDASDFVSVIVFSGHDRSRVIVSPTQCTADGRANVIKEVQAHVRVMDTTVFSEPLQKAVVSVKSLSAINAVHAVTLFTDGVAVPTRWSADQERDKALEFVDALSELKAIVSVVGYGVHYDEEFLDEVWGRAGCEGVWRHISEIEQFPQVMAELREIIAVTDQTAVLLYLKTDNPKTKVTRILRAGPQLNSYRTDSIMSDTLYDGKLVLFAELSGPATGLSITGSIGGEKINLTPKAIPLTGDTLKQYLMVAAATEYLFGDRGKVEDLMRQAGAAGLARRAANAYSPREQREVCDLMRRVYQDRSFIGQGLKDYGPSNNALNIIRWLIEHEHIVVIIPRGAYQRSGELTSDPRVIHTGDKVLKVVGYVSHANRLNFSLRALKDVKIAPTNGGAPTNAQIWRTYNVVLDGNLHLPELEVNNLTVEDYTELQGSGAIHAGQSYAQSKTYTLNLRNVPLVSPVWANPKQLGLVPLLQEEADLQLAQTALNAHIKILPIPKGVAVDVTDGIYHEDATKVEDVPKEYYLADCVEYRIMRYKGAAPADIRAMDWDEAQAEVKKVRQRLIVVRFLIRAITFAMEVTGSKTIPWGTPTQTNKGKNPKDEQLAFFDNATLKRVVWTQEEVCS